MPQPSDYLRYDVGRAEIVIEHRIVLNGPDPAVGDDTHLFQTTINKKNPVTFFGQPAVEFPSIVFTTSQFSYSLNGNVQ